MVSTCASVVRPYTPGSRVPSRLRFGPCSTRTFMTSRSLASVRAERRHEPVGDREEQEPREHRPAERGPAFAVHLRDEIGRGQVDGDAGRQCERVTDVMLGHEARGHRARDGQRAQGRARADRRRARLTAGQHDRRDRDALGHLVQAHRDGEQHAEGGSDHEPGRDRDAVEERVDAETEQREVPGRGMEQRLRVALLAEVEVRRHRVVGEALVSLGAVKDDDVLRALAQQQNLAYLTRDELPAPLPIVKNLSPKYLRQYAVCPVSVEGSVLTVATADPLNPIIVDDLAQSTGLSVRVVVCPADAIVEAIDRTYDGVATPLQRIVEGMDDDRAGEGDVNVNQRGDTSFEAPVVRLVNLLIENAITSEASDIHIEPFEDTLRIRYRIDGVLFDQEAPPRRLQAAVTSRVKLMAEMNIAERRLPQDGRIRVTLHNRRVDIRTSTIPTVHGESIVMRLLDRQSVFLPLESLGCPPGMLRGVEGRIGRARGA